MTIKRHNREDHFKIELIADTRDCYDEKYNITIFTHNILELMKVEKKLKKLDKKGLLNDELIERLSRHSSSFNYKSFKKLPFNDVNNITLKIKNKEDVIFLNYDDITMLLKMFNIEDNRYDKYDFDGGHFDGTFDNELLALNYIRVCVTEKDSNKDTNMIIIRKDFLDNLIVKNFNNEKLKEADFNYKNKDSEFYEDYIGAFYDLYEPIFQDLKLNLETTCMYIDGLDYILSVCNKIAKDK